MADVRTVRGTLGGAKVATSEENAQRLGTAFKAEKSADKSSSPSKSSK